MLMRGTLLLALLPCSSPAPPGGPLVGAPIALADAYTTTVGDNLSVDAPGVLENDSDPDGDPLQAVLIDSSGASGHLVLDPDGSLEYEVPPGFVGTDTFTYVATDGVQSSPPTQVTFTVEAGPITNAKPFTNQASFLSAVAAQGWSTAQESFESPVWPRTPSTSASVSNLGVTWTGNNPTSQVTTGTGPAIFGQYGFFQLPHGNYATGADCNTPGNCTDGWIATADEDVFVAAGIWIHCNAGTAGIEFVLDGDAENPVDFDGAKLPAGSTGFFGVLDSNGFRSIEVHETEGKAEDASYIFADLFTFALQPGASVVPFGCGVNPPSSLVVSSGTPAIGTTLGLSVDNPLGTQAPGSLPFVGLASAPAPGYPCGLLLDGFGMAGPDHQGELLMDLAPPNPLVLFVGTPWAGAGPSAPLEFELPPNPNLLGVSLYAQGGLLDFSIAAPAPVGLSTGLVLRIGLG